MLFNSLDFFVFLIVFFILYWFVTNKNRKHQNLLIVFASYLFYGWWDWRFLFLIFISTCIDFFIGNLMGNQLNKRKRKIYLYISLTTNLGILGFFKYYNFFVESLIEAFLNLGIHLSTITLNIVLPVGISFYTFQTLSYTIDVFRGNIKATKDFIAFSAFVSFFPQLVAGPIERATNLLPQFYKNRVFNKGLAIIGLRQIIWGLFKKIVIADNCAQYANEIFEQYQNYSSLTLVVGAICFAFQIYCDFSGYSDIAIGLAKVFGFDMKRNFNYPYFSRDVAEFWRRWHISLSTWFRDYLYIPLGGSKGGVLNKVKNTLIVFTVSGVWHGANWTFFSWGLLNALLFLPLILSNKNRNHIGTVAENKMFPTILEFYKILRTFIIITITWVFFRAKTIQEAVDYLTKILDFTLVLDKLRIERYALEILPIILGFILFEWFYRSKEFPLVNDGKYFHKTLIAILCILLFGSFSNVSEFIYFQF